MIEFLTSLITSLVLWLSETTQPTKARCPCFAGACFIVVNVRTSDHFEPRGTFTCERPALGGDTDVLTGKTTAVAQPGEIKGRLYCTGGSSPIVVRDPEARTVGCSR